MVFADIIVGELIDVANVAPIYDMEAFLIIPSWYLDSVLVQMMGNELGIKENVKLEAQLYSLNMDADLITWCSRLFRNLSIFWPCEDSLWISESIEASYHYKQKFIFKYKAFKLEVYKISYSFKWQENDTKLMALNSITEFLVEQTLSYISF